MITWGQTAGIVNKPKLDDEGYREWSEDRPTQADRLITLDVSRMALLAALLGGVFFALGFNNIRRCRHLLCLSSLCLLPRLLPSFIELLENRPSTLPAEPNGHVVSIHSDNKQDDLQYFGNLLHGSGIPHNHLFTVREVTITALRNRPLIRPRRFSPLNLITLTSAILSLVLLLWAIWLHDTFAVSGILSVSLDNAMLSATNKWKLPPFERVQQQQERKAAAAGDVVILSSSPTGATFTIVRCTPEVAHMLYFTLATPRYFTSYRVGFWVGLISGLLSMGLTMLFYYSSSTMQAAVVVSYVVLHVMYWRTSRMEDSKAWEFGLEVDEVYRRQYRIYLDALWKTLRMTGELGWARRLRGAVEENVIWDKWLEWAARVLSGEVEESDPLEAYREIQRREQEAEKGAQ